MHIENYITKCFIEMMELESKRFVRKRKLILVAILNRSREIVSKKAMSE